LIAWQEARKLVQMVYQLTGKSRFSHDFGLIDQIQRAAISTMANIAESFDCESRTEFGRFLGIARRSVVEVQSLLYIVTDNQYSSADEFEQSYKQAQKTKALIGGLKFSLDKRKV
jgi:four helix bundle protein